MGESGQLERRSKELLRRRLRRARAEIPAEDRSAAHAAIVRRLFTLSRDLEPGGLVGLYAATPSEADPSGLSALLPDGRVVAWPRVRGAELELVACPDGELVAGFRGIREPPLGLVAAPLGDLRMLVVPGLGFDSSGRRLGQGGGHYDRLLARVRAEAPRALVVGVAYAVQIVGRVPTEGHDLPVDVVVTERGFAA